MSANDASSDAITPASRPTTINDLVRRLRDPATSTKERAALQALASKMIDIFNNDKFHVHINEAAALAPCMDRNNYQTLLWAFIDAVTMGRADGRILHPEVSTGFIRVLRSADSIKIPAGEQPVNMRLGLVLDNLQDRLQSAVHQVEPETQYQMVDTLAKVLDAMNDTKTAGISREKYREPLLKTLKILGESNEIRLAQVAAYAYEALRGIPDDEGPYKALLRHSMAFVEAGAKIAGAVSTMDPSKLFDGLVALSDIPDLVSTMIDVVKQISESSDAIKGVVHDVKLQQTSKEWYVALRFADVFIQAHEFAKLEEFIRDVPCRCDFDFLCGLYAQLERAWTTAGMNGNVDTVGYQDAIRSIIDHLPAPRRHSDDLAHIEAWKKATRTTCGGGPLEAAANNPRPSIRNAIRSKLKKSKEYSYKVVCLSQTDRPTAPGLLELAWLACNEAQVWYADAKLRDHYLADNEKLLQIIRISGDQLSMAQCYINLAIMEKKADDKKETSRSTLSSRLKVDDVHEDKSVTLDKLFEPRKCTDGRVRAPRRMLIRGRAGVGKTTLCKKIMYEFTRRPVHEAFCTWTERYDRVLWLPLRNLKRHKAHPGYSLTELLKEEFFPRSSESTTFSKALGDHCSTGAGNSRTLFLLDGFDEVSELLDSDHEMAGFLRWLLRQPSAIITSRPGGKHSDSLMNLDCELETVGFHTGQVRAYVRHTIGNIGHRIAMLKFLDSRPLLLSLMRIPVQLDAFCYIWNDRPRPTDSAAAAADAVSDSENLSSMTSIYQSIERRLWCKDMPRLYKKHGSGYITVASALELGSSEARRLVQGEIRFLQALAFVGFYHDVVNFHPQECDDVLGSLEGSTLNGPLSDMLGSLSFLRASDVSAPHLHNTARQMPLQRTYHFVHLTYQEYFAAQFFVLCWTSGTRLGCPEFGTRRPVDLDTADFLQQNKYRSRFNIFWRFVAGILRDQDHSHGHASAADSKSTKGHLARFFHALEQEPRDILGAAHQRLVMYCLSEADPMHNRPLFDKHRELLRQWMVWECNTDEFSPLANEAEFPPLIYETVMQQMPDDIQRSTMKVHGASAAYFQYVANEIAKNTTLSDWATEQLGSFHRLPLSILHTLVPPLNNVFKTDQLVFSYEMQLRRQLIVDTISNNLPDAMPYFFHFLTDREITKQASNPDDIIGFADHFIDWFTRRVQSSIPSMGWQALSAEENERLSRYLQDPIKSVRIAAMLALFFQNPLPKAALDTLLSRLQHPDERVVKDTVEELLQAKPLPNELRTAVTQCLRSPNEGTRTCAAALLVSFKGLLPDSDSDAILGALAGADDETRLAVAQAMGSATATLTAKMIDLLHKWLEDGPAEIRIAAAKALLRQTLPNHVLRTLCTLLRGDPSRDVRVQAARVLGHMKTSPPPEVVHELLLAIDDLDISVSEMVRRSLLKLDLSDSALVGVLQIINSKTSGGARFFRELFANRQAPTQSVADALLDKLQECEVDDELHYNILKTLYDQANTLPETTVRALFEEHQRILVLVETDIDENIEERKLYGMLNEKLVLFDISGILSRRTKLPTDVYERLLDQLHNGSDVASEMAAKALSHVQLLAPEVISGLAMLAQSENIDVRALALRILAYKEILHADVLHLFATSLRKCISDYRVSYHIHERLHIVSDEDYSHILGCDEVFSDMIEKWLNESSGDVTLYPDGDMHYIVNLPQGAKRILKADLPMSVEQYMEKKGIPKALDQE